ncbi:hypothetical protein L5014_30725, partial [Paraburkholderia sp. RG36]|nr:hypothetical protein [Paraburkholderia tagetis]
KIQEVLRRLGKRQWIAEKWTNALERRAETVKMASKNSALSSNGIDRNFALDIIGLITHDSLHRFAQVVIQPIDRTV